MVGNRVSLVQINDLLSAGTHTPLCAVRGHPPPQSTISLPQDYSVPPLHGHVRPHYLTHVNKCVMNRV